MSSFFTVDIISDQCFFYFATFCPSRHFLHSTFFRSMFFTFWHFVPVDIFYLVCFVPVSVFFHSMFCPIQRFFFWRFGRRRFLQSAFYTQCFVGDRWIHPDLHSTVPASEHEPTCILRLVSLYCYDCNPEMGLLCVQLLWLLLPIDDGLKPPREGLHEVHQGLCWVTVQL
jgi:hypothetical protein